MPSVNGIQPAKNQPPALVMFNLFEWIIFPMSKGKIENDVNNRSGSLVWIGIDQRRRFSTINEKSNITYSFIDQRIAALKAATSVAIVHVLLCLVLLLLLILHLLCNDVLYGLRRVWRIKCHIIIIKKKKKVKQPFFENWKAPLILNKFRLLKWSMTHSLTHIEKLWWE